MTKSRFRGLECSRCGEQSDGRSLVGMCPCGGPLLARYRLEEAREALPREALTGREPTLWRYEELLPDPGEHRIGMGEGFTPLLEAPRLGRELGLERVYFKDETVNPTGSFKARGMSTAVSMARALGARRLALPSAGNAGSAAAAYGARAGMEVDLFLPESAPFPFRLEAEACGARVHLVRGPLSDCGTAVRTRAEARGWFDLSTLREPYRLEGKKTMGFELAEQLGWELPEVVIYPTGGGTGLIGMWKAFSEMVAMGWIEERFPRMISVQSSGCAPIVRAFQRGADRADPWEDPRTEAAGLCVPSSVGDFLILRALRQSGGKAVAVDDTEMREGIRAIGRAEGFVTSPEAGATYAALRHLVQDGSIQPRDRVVLFLTGTGLKYLDSLAG